MEAAWKCEGQMISGPWLSSGSDSSRSFEASVRGSHLSGLSKSRRGLGNAFTCFYKMGKKLRELFSTRALRLHKPQTPGKLGSVPDFLLPYITESGPLFPKGIWKEKEKNASSFNSPTAGEERKQHPSGKTKR